MPKSSWYEKHFGFEGADDAKCKLCNCIIKRPDGATSAMEKHFIASHPSFAASPKNEKKRMQQSPVKPLEQSTFQQITPIPQMEKVNLSRSFHIRVTQPVSTDSQKQALKSPVFTKRITQGSAKMGRGQSKAKYDTAHLVVLDHVCTNWLTG